MHKDEILDLLDSMLESVELIEKRFSRIRLAEDFVLSSDGVTLLDAVAMRLQVISESVRKIQKLDVLFLNHYSNIEWDKLARFRDLVSHHYSHIDHEIVYDICKVHIPKLKHALQKIRSDFPNYEDKQV
jgi:uncharacterized protein with HEPN domain